MSYYDDASLVVIPSGYKTSKVYAEKPTDGSGDLTFTRTGDTATRVNSAGLIEKVRTNLITYSEQLDNAAWTKSQVTISPNLIISPDGTTTADTAIETTANAQHYVGSSNVSFLASTKYTATVYAKWDASCTRNLHVRLGNCASVNIGASFDKNGNFVNYTGGANGTLDAYSFTNVGNGWLRFAVTITTAATASSGNGIILYFLDGTSPNFIGSTSQKISLWGAQLETGDIATAYIPTTTAAVSVGPTANTARLDYLGSTCPRLILEPQRQNLVTFSEQFNNAAWSKTAGGTGTAPAVTANNATSPDGYQNADTIVFNAGAGTSASDQSTIYQTISSLPAGTYTCSFYAKTASGTAQIMVRHAGAANFTKFTITDQWQRFTSTEVKGSTSTAYLEILIRRGLNEPINASATIQLWGVQLELGSFATSYVPTLAASATRGADACSKTDISSLIGQTEGTVFLDADYIASTGSNYNTLLILTPAGGAGSGFVVIDRYPNNRVVCEYNQGGSQAKITSATTYGSQRLKIAFAYKANDFVAYVNGVQIGTDNSGTTGLTLSQLLIVYAPNLPDGGKMNQALLFKTRLTNAELAELTTL